MDKTTAYELVGVTALLLFAGLVWVPLALLATAVCCLILAWVESGAPLPRRRP